MPHYNTATGAHESPAPDAQTTRTSDEWVDPRIDTKAEARLYQERMQRLEGELADVNVTGTRKYVAQRELESLKKALPLQIAAWREIDARRGR